MSDLQFQLPYWRESIFNPLSIRKCYVKSHDVLSDFISKNNLIEISAYRSEMRSFPVYKAIHNNTELCVIQAAVDSSSIAMMTDFLIGHGVETIIARGGCGVLDDIPAGDVIIPTFCFT